MRTHAFLAAVALASAAFAQSPLTTLTAGGNSGNAGGGIYFDLTVNTTVTFTQIDYYASTASTAGNSYVDVYLGPGTYLGNATTPAQWVLVASTVPVPITVPAAPLLVNGVLSTPFALGPGNYGVALKSNIHSWSYTNGTACSSTTVPGACSNSTFSTAELTFRGGSASNVFQTLPTFQPRIFNGALHYTNGGIPTPVASWQAVGKGCYGRWTSFYEVFANPAGLDLGNSAIRLTLNGNSYNVAASTNTYVSPVGSPVTLLSTTTPVSVVANSGPLPFPLVHPSATGVAADNDLQIAPSGYLVPNALAGSPPITVDITPTAAEVLSGPTRWMPHWKNMMASTPVAPSGIYIEYDTVAVPPEIRISFDAIADRGSVSTFQVVFYPTGDVEYRYGTMSLTGGGSYPAIVGWTLGGGALDRGSMDITAALPFSTGTLNNPPLTLACQNRPLIGTNPVLQITNHELTQPVGFILLDLVGAPGGLPLIGFGMPECSAYVQLATSLTSLYFVAPITTINFPIPNSTSYNGVEVYAQAAAIGSTFNNAFGVGANTSNGVLMRVGNL